MKTTLTHTKPNLNSQSQTYQIKLSNQTYQKKCTKSNYQPNPLKTNLTKQTFQALPIKTMISFRDGGRERRLLLCGQFRYNNQFLLTPPFVSHYQDCFGRQGLESLFGQVCTQVSMYFHFHVGCNQKLSLGVPTWTNLQIFFLAL